MKNFINRVKRARWTYKQSLTKIPKESDARISDLFVWRNSEEWQTFFELIDIPTLFSQRVDGRHYVDIILFDAEGHTILKNKVDLAPNQRKVISLSELLCQVKQAEELDEYGTFAIFHSTVPEVVLKLNSFIAERGYVSYKYRNSPLRSYVHGNLDAVSMQSGKLNMLGGQGLLTRQYQLQHELNGPASYELGVVNTSNSKKTVRCKVKSVDHNFLEEKIETINPRGVKILSIDVDSAHSVRTIIESRLVMARPLVFRINENYFDVFHG